MVKLYEVLDLNGKKSTYNISEGQWFEVFRHGIIYDEPIVWIQPKGDESKRVTFAENVVDVSQLL